MHTNELVDVFLGHLNKACVFTIPNNPSKMSTQTLKEYKLSLGFEADPDSGVDGFEDFQKYCNRMTISVALYAAIAQTSPWNGEAQPKGIALGDMWTWFATIINTKPYLMTAPILLAALEVAGYEMHRTYKRQFHKLLVLLEENVCPLLSTVSLKYAGERALCNSLTRTPKQVLQQLL